MPGGGHVGGADQRGERRDLGGLGKLLLDAGHLGAAALGLGQELGPGDLVIVIVGGDLLQPRPAGRQLGAQPGHVNALAGGGDQVSSVGTGQFLDHHLLHQLVDRRDRDRHVALAGLLAAVDGPVGISTGLAMAAALSALFSLLENNQADRS